MKEGTRPHPAEGADKQRSAKEREAEMEESGEENAVLVGAAAVLALTGGRRVLGWTAAAIATFTVVAAPLAFNGIGQASEMLFFAWTIGASIGLLRGEPRRAAIPVTA
jgi:hypothetical protein